MSCVLKEPIYKFVDRLILSDQVLEKKNGEWQSFCTGLDEQVTVLDGSAKCSWQQPLFFARKISSVELDAFSKICEKNDLYNYTAYVDRPFIFENWDTDINIFNYHFIKSRNCSDGFLWQELQGEEVLEQFEERLLNTNYYIVEKTEFYFNKIRLLDFEVKMLKYSKELSRITIPQNVLLVQPSDGTGLGTIRDIVGNPWNIINFSEKSSFDCEEVKLF